MRILAPRMKGWYAELVRIPQKCLGISGAGEFPYSILASQMLGGHNLVAQIPDAGVCCSMLDLDPQLMQMRDNIGASLAHYAASGGHEGVLEFLDTKVPEMVRRWSLHLFVSGSRVLFLFTAWPCIFVGGAFALRGAFTTHRIWCTSTDLPPCAPLPSLLLWI